VEKNGVDNTQKFTNTGESIASVQKKIQDQKAWKCQMMENIQFLCKTDGQCRNFLIMKTNQSLEEDSYETGFGNSGGQCWPSELAIGVCNLTRGFVPKSCYADLVDTKNFPLGTRSKVQDSVQETGLPFPGSELFQSQHSDYDRILRNLKKFIQDYIGEDEKYKKTGLCVFVYPQFLHHTKSCIDWLLKNSKGSDKGTLEEFFYPLKYYSVGQLVLGLATEAAALNPRYGNRLITETYAMELLQRGSYNYVTEINCDFHKQPANQDKMSWCAKNIVIRTVKLLFDEFVPAFQIPQIEQHELESLTFKIPESKPRPITRSFQSENNDNSGSTANIVQDPVPGFSGLSISNPGPDGIFSEQDFPDALGDAAGWTTATSKKNGRRGKGN